MGTAGGSGAARARPCIGAKAERVSRQPGSRCPRGDSSGALLAWDTVRGWAWGLSVAPAARHQVRTQWQARCRGSANQQVSPSGSPPRSRQGLPGSTWAVRKLRRTQQRGVPARPRSSGPGRPQPAMPLLDSPVTVGVKMLHSRSGGSTPWHMAQSDDPRRRHAAACLGRKPCAGLAEEMKATASRSLEGQSWP